MALQSRSPAAHNKMLGQRINHPKSTNFHEDDGSSPRPQKRLKREQPTEGAISDAPPSSQSRFRTIPDSDADSDGDDNAIFESSRKTDLESALPPVTTDQEAIDEYEASRAAEGADTATAGDRLNERKWVKGRSSIYVDAFNLALETVLDEESHLFDDAEKALFGYWHGLNYEAQYLLAIY
jgi:Fanconi-associated nuclease 1